MIDSHCHILWGIDDASKTRSQSIDMIRVAIADGITHIIATPHIKEPIFHNTPHTIERAYTALVQAIHEEQMNIEIVIGAENYVSKHTMYLLNEGGFLPLGKSKYMLIEFAWTINMHDDLTRYIKQIIHAGYTPIIAHPERYEWVHRDYSLIKQWRDMGCLMQLNRTSILGMDKMKLANTFATQMLVDDLVDVIASDAHASYAPRLPKLSDVYTYIKNIYGEEKANRYIIENPKKFI